MQSSTCSKYTFNKGIGSQTTFVLDNSHKFGTSYGMLHAYPNARNSLIELFLFFRKFLSLLLFDRLYNCCPFRCIPLIAGILIKEARYRKGIHCIRHLLVVYLARNGLADKQDQARYSNDDGILYRMTLLLTAVLLFLFVIINGARYFPFSTVMKQYGMNATILGEFRQPCGKFFIRLSWYKPHCLKAQT